MKSVNEKAPAGLPSEQGASENLFQTQNITAQAEKQVENMSLLEIVEECKSYYCCGDCKLKTVCDKYFWPERPHRWELNSEGGDI